MLRRQHAVIVGRLAQPWARVTGADRPAPAGILAFSGFVPTVEGVLMTGSTARYLRARPAWPGDAGESVFAPMAIYLADTSATLIRRIRRRANRHT